MSGNMVELTHPFHKVVYRVSESARAQGEKIAVDMRRNGWTAAPVVGYRLDLSGVITPLNISDEQLSADALLWGSCLSEQRPNEMLLTRETLVREVDHLLKSGASAVKRSQVLSESEFGFWWDAHCVDFNGMSRKEQAEALCSAGDVVIMDEWDVEEIEEALCHRAWENPEAGRRIANKSDEICRLFWTRPQLGVDDDVSIVDIRKRQGWRATLNRVMLGCSVEGKDRDEKAEMFLRCQSAMAGYFIQGKVWGDMDRATGAAAEQDVAQGVAPPAESNKGSTFLGLGG